MTHDFAIARLVEVRNTLTALAAKMGKMQGKGRETVKIAQQITAVSHAINQLERMKGLEQ
jgi:DNA-binding FrmR family transcriptional regulator